MAQAQMKFRMLRIIKGLKKEFPEAKIRLNFKNPFELLVATILSAQCTDDRVNIVTPELFKKYPGPRELAGAPIGKIQELVKPTGFYQAKSLSIKESSIAIMNDHAGEVPQTIEELVKLRGVGRKTANVVLGNAFGKPGMVVDRHFARVTRRMGFTKSEDPVEIEFELMKIVPEDEWTPLSHLLLFHGRKHCKARNPACKSCPVAEDCAKEFGHG